MQDREERAHLASEVSDPLRDLWGRQRVPQAQPALPEEGALSSTPGPHQTHLGGAAARSPAASILGGSGGMRAGPWRLQRGQKRGG